MGYPHYAEGIGHEDGLQTLLKVQPAININMQQGATAEYRGRPMFAKQTGPMPSASIPFSPL